MDLRRRSDVEPRANRLREYVEELLENDTLRHPGFSGVKLAMDARRTFDGNASRLDVAGTAPEPERRADRVGRHRSVQVRRIRRRHAAPRRPARVSPPPAV